MAVGAYSRIELQMKYLKNLSLAKRLGLLLLFPLLSLGYFVSVEIMHDLHEIEEAEKNLTLPRYFSSLANVIHELQKERGKSVGFLSSEGGAFQSALIAQRSKTDDAIAQFRSLHAESAPHTLSTVADSIDKTMPKLEKLDAFRPGVDTQSAATNSVKKVYTALINDLLLTISSVTKEVESGEVAADIVAFLDVMKSGEAAALERDTLVKVFTLRALAHPDFIKLVSLVAKQDANNSHFLGTVPPKQQTVLNQALESEPYQRALTEREHVFSVAAGNRPASSLKSDPESVFSTQTLKIDELKIVEEQLTADLSKIANKQLEHGEQLLVIAVAEALFTLVITVCLALWIVRGIVSKVNTAVEAAWSVGEGDLTKNIDTSDEDELGQLLTSLSATQGRLQGVIKEIQSTAISLDTGAQEIVAGNMNLSDRTQSQSQSLVAINQKISALSEAVHNSTHRQSAGDKLAQQALELTTNCSGMVQQLYLSMQEIKDASKSVGTITSVIDEIAFQTNLLSLNAAVEAARAGESGKGFAVVAAEVRQLAQRSSTAASEISELIGNSMQKIGKGGELADSARDALNEVEASVRSVTDVMGELSDSSQEQAGDIENISAMVREIDDVTQRNAALVEEVAASSESLGNSSAELSRAIQYFSVK